MSHLVNNLFISKRDKASYNEIVKNHIDCLRDLGETSRIKLSLDKIFITNDLQSTDAKIVKHSIGSIDHYLISVKISEIKTV